MASTSEILAAYDSQLRRLVPQAASAGHKYEQPGPLLRVTFLHVDASADSEPIRRRRGFRAITVTTPFVWTFPRGREFRAT